MRRIISAREQYELLTPWRQPPNRATRRTAKYLRVPNPIKDGSLLDQMGFTPRKFNGNFNSWIDASSPEQRATGLLWYPVGHEWGAHVSDRHDAHPDKVYGVLSKTSPQCAWPQNIRDAWQVIHNHVNGNDPMPIPGISGRNNLQQALRVMSAPDHPDHIESAFLGTKNVKRGGQKVPIPQTPDDIPKTYDFHHTLRDPELGGAGNYMKQPGVVDSWMARSMMWSKDAWEKAKAKEIDRNGRFTGTTLPWPGKGSGQGLDKPTEVKKVNEATGKYEVTGFRKPNARDVALRVLDYSGAYDGMRNAMRQGAARHDMPYTHGAQATVWDQIGGTPNPVAPPRHGLDLSTISDPNELYNEMWSRRVSGLVTPADPHGMRGPGGLILPPGHGELVHASLERQAFAAPEEYDTEDENWGTPEDHANVLRHCLSRPGWDHWEDRPKDPAEQDEPMMMAAGYDPFEFSHAEGPHDTPWSGEEAEKLRKPCEYCGAHPGEPCDTRCPTHHFYDEKDQKAIGPDSYTPSDDLHLRLNSVQDTLSYVDRLLEDQ